jgi:hypothetical protein
MTSSNTFNVGAPTFGVREQSSRFYDVSRIAAFPFWNHAPVDPSMTLKTNYLVKPSSNTLNVGAPTFSMGALLLDGFRTLTGLKPGGCKPPIFVGAGFQPGQPSAPPAVSR